MRDVDEKLREATAQIIEARKLLCRHEDALAEIPPLKLLLRQVVPVIEELICDSDDEHDPWVKKFEAWHERVEAALAQTPHPKPEGSEDRGTPS